ncbi:MAG: nuclear transport factor 2 family protein [Ilumatobacteraceae bacterium]|nr:nuclear transport factor 2 family protein [Ilumatobacteraceae bacterium]
MNTDDLRLVDRVALRTLVETYAHRVDRREFPSLVSLFTPDGKLSGYSGQPIGQAADYERIGHAQIERAMQGLLKYDITNHSLSQQMILFDPIDPDKASAETYCYAQHLYSDNGRWNRIMSIRYLDKYERIAGVWLIADRRLATDWIEIRPVVEPN